MNRVLNNKYEDRAEAILSRFDGEYVRIAHKVFKKDELPPSAVYMADKKGSLEHIEDVLAQFYSAVERGDGL